MSKSNNVCFSLSMHLLRSSHVLSDSLINNLAAGDTEDFSLGHQGWRSKLARCRLQLARVECNSQDAKWSRSDIVDCARTLAAVDHWRWNSRYKSKGTGPWFTLVLKSRTVFQLLAKLWVVKSEMQRPLLASRYIITESLLVCHSA